MSQLYITRPPPYTNDEKTSDFINHLMDPCELVLSMQDPNITIIIGGDINQLISNLISIKFILNNSRRAQVTLKRLTAFVSAVCSHFWETGLELLEVIWK